ncbi:glycosyl hydrolases family 38 N-terminal domain-containing protein [Kickxella alabastrina]|uniref:glycosyl hydrolases family 38 N-terminal domain-containing protein n=1 Tax=Kickxella alabastrina TaxID=61397 RepID=UPI00221F733E|nr:glycosyl hydrolases family 38 N-terminal domain-containing protein [Kickxella alabastrina]KAI7833296.1 glycosyl hydrolases family 38 N-terminal domain-containing protein [Kickxella alabastrina]
MSYLQKHPDVTKSRLNTFMSNGQFKKANIHASLYESRVNGLPHVQMEVWAADGQERPTFEHAVKQEFQLIEVGHSFGLSWSTHWVRATLQIPSEFAGKEVRLIFDPSCEAMVWSAEGQALQGITGGNGQDRRVNFVVTKKAKASETKRVLYLEVACNGMFGLGDYLIGPPDENRSFTLNTADLVVKQVDAWALYYDLDILKQMIEGLPKDSPRWWQALSTANAIINAYDAKDSTTLTTGLEISRKFFGAKSGDATHQVFAIGNCHIDTAWLWPYDETKRKIARSWSTQLDLLDRFPEYRFAASQAQQFEWLKELYPGLFARIKDKIKTGQFIPIGCTWIEMDCNVPSGESLTRQFLLGQRFFEEHFGERCLVFWLPDTFGYSSQLPQIVRQAGAKYFFTQKLSWNNINKFPHTTFNWVGLDGSSVLTHMAPAETYTANATANQLIESVKKHKDVAYTNESLYLYGHGDGGGGPNEGMLERLRRMEDVDGLPRVKQAHPNEFYEHVEKTAKDLVSWRGELYFELHRGTYTSQAKTKKQNRQAEFLLRDLELLSVVARSLGKNFVYPSKEITRLWKLACLNQFHDVIPGSSIEMVYKDSDAIYADVLKSAAAMKQEAVVSLFGGMGLTLASEATGILVANTTSWPRTEIVAVPGLSAQLGAQQVRKQDQAALMVATTVPGCGLQLVNPTKTADAVPVSVHRDKGGCVVLENLYVAARFSAEGQLVSFIDRRTERELVLKGQSGNVLRLHDDVPIFWDAWDIEIYNLEKFTTVKATKVTIVDEGPLLASISVEIPIGEGSKMLQIISLSAISPRLEFACDVDWHENHKCLKVGFSWDIRSDFATYETQYGVVQRPTHRNTTWDMAKFEVCAHKFADLSEYGYGVALLNDSKYGYATLENTMALTLLRSPKSPDAHCDMGQQTFRYAVFPHQGSFNESKVVQEAYQFNVPLIQMPVDMKAASSSAMTAAPYFSVTAAPNVVLDAVKAPEDGSHDIIVRLYEAYGGHASATVSIKIGASSVVKTDIMEERADNLELRTLANGAGKSVVVDFKPFEIVTLRFAA